MAPALILQCPNCKEYISSDAATCRFCSTPLDPRVVEKGVAAQAKENRRDRKRHYLKYMLIGAGLFAGGLIITVGTFLYAATSEGGGHFLITYGLMISGVLNLIYGLFGWIGELRSKD